MILINEVHCVTGVLIRVKETKKNIPTVLEACLKRCSAASDQAASFRVSGFLKLACSCPFSAMKRATRPATDGARALRVSKIADAQRQGSVDVASDARRSPAGKQAGCPYKEATRTHVCDSRTGQVAGTRTLREIANWGRPIRPFWVRCMVRCS